LLPGSGAAEQGYLVWQDLNAVRELAEQQAKAGKTVNFSRRGLKNNFMRQPCAHFRGIAFQQ
jgi:hypothetical protein